MRLIDVEALGHPAQGDRPPAGSAEAATPETTTAFALHAIAKLLNSLLHILFVASAEVHAYYISPAGHARQPEFAFGVGRRSVPLPRQSIGRGYRHSRQWRLAASRRTIDFIGWQSRGSRHGLRRREGRHLLRRQGRRKRNRRE